MKVDRLVSAVSCRTVWLPLRLNAGLAYISFANRLSLIGHEVWLVPPSGSCEIPLHEVVHRGFFLLFWQFCR